MTRPWQWTDQVVKHECNRKENFWWKPRKNPENTGNKLRKLEIRWRVITIQGPAMWRSTRILRRVGLQWRPPVSTGLANSEPINYIRNNWQEYNCLKRVGSECSKIKENNKWLELLEANITRQRRKKNVRKDNPK